MVAYNTIQRRNMGELYNAVEWATELSCLSHREIAGSSFADLQVAESFADLQVAERCARLTEPIVKVYVYIYIYTYTPTHTYRCIQNMRDLKELRCVLLEQSAALLILQGLVQFRQLWNQACAQLNNITGGGCGALGCFFGLRVSSLGSAL